MEEKFISSTTKEEATDDRQLKRLIDTVEHLCSEVCNHRAETNNIVDELDRMGDAMAKMSDFAVVLAQLAAMQCFQDGSYDIAVQLQNFVKQ